MMQQQQQQQQQPSMMQQQQMMQLLMHQQMQMQQQMQAFGAAIPNLRGRLVQPNSASGAGNIRPDDDGASFEQRGGFQPIFDPADGHGPGSYGEQAQATARHQQEMLLQQLAQKTSAEPPIQPQTKGQRSVKGQRIQAASPRRRKSLEPLPSQRRRRRLSPPREGCRGGRAAKRGSRGGGSAGG